VGAFFLLASGLHRKLVGFESLENRDFSTMGLPCIQCCKSFPPGHTFEFIVYDEGAYFFCSEECKDKWVSVNAQEINLENLQHPSI
jgi:YHS domain-containing protein